MAHTIKLNPLIHEFETVEDKVAYDEWLAKKIEKSRQSRTMTSDEARQMVRQALL